MFLLLFYLFWLKLYADRVCSTDDYSVTSIEIIQSPDEWQKILVMGDKAVDLQSKLDEEVAASKFCEFTIFTQNIQKTTKNEVQRPLTLSINTPTNDRQMKGMILKLLLHYEHVVMMMDIIFKQSYYIWMLVRWVLQLIVRDIFWIIYIG